MQALPTFGFVVDPLHMLHHGTNNNNKGLGYYYYYFFFLKASITRDCISFQQCSQPLFPPLLSPCCFPKPPPLAPLAPPCLSHCGWVLNTWLDAK